MLLNSPDCAPERPDKGFVINKHKTAMKINSLLCVGILGSALSAPALTLNYSVATDGSFNDQVTINGTAYPYAGGLSVWINSNNSVGNQVNQWMVWGIDGGGTDNRTLFQFALPKTSPGNFSLSDVQFGVHDDWGNWQSWRLDTTTNFTSAATWNNPGSGAPSGGARLQYLGEAGGNGGNELVWDAQSGYNDLNDGWVYSLTNLLGVATTSLTSTNPVDLAVDTAWGQWSAQDGGSAPYLQLTLTLNNAPLIVTQPSVAPTNTVYSGNTIALSVVAATDYTPTFQWYKDGTLIDPTVNLNATITSTNAYDSEFVLVNTATTDSGHYYVVVTDSNGSVRSVTNNVTILPHVSPIITAQPQAQTGYAPGQAVSLSAGVTGTPPFTYQWKHAGTNLVDDGVKYFGSASNVLTIAALNLTAADVGSYVLTITNNFGGTNTQAAALTVIPNLAENPLFGDGVSASDFTDWTPSGSTVEATDATYGTVAHLPYAWEFIYEYNSGVTFQAHTLYTLTAALHGSAGVYGVFNDGTTDTDWLGGGYNWLGGGGWADHTFTFDTGATPSVVGDALGFRFRADSGDVYVANVRVTAAPGAAAPAPTITAPAWSTSTAGAFQFTINSWPQTAYNVLVSSDLKHWTTNNVYTNVSGSDVFLDTTPTGSPRFYKLQAH